MRDCAQELILHAIGCFRVGTCGALAGEPLVALGLGAARVMDVDRGPEPSRARARDLEPDAVPPAFSVRPAHACLDVGRAALANRPAEAGVAPRDVAGMDGV